MGGSKGVAIKAVRAKRAVHAASLFKREYPERVVSQIRSDPMTLQKRQLPRSALNNGAYADINGRIASRRCPTCSRFCSEEDFYAGAALLVQVGSRGELRDVLVHRQHLEALRQINHVAMIEEAAEKVAVDPKAPRDPATPFLRDPLSARGARTGMPRAAIKLNNFHRREGAE